MAKHIIITGGAGFLGFHLSKRLLIEGHHVTIIDNLYTGNINNIHELEQYGDLNFVYQDLVNLDYDQEQIDEIYNLACPASPIRYQKDPVGTIMVCVEGTRRLLELAKKHKARFLQTSTSEVYGESSNPTQNEYDRGNVNCFGPRACYDEGKRCAEALIYTYKDSVNIHIARLFNSYGPYMSCEDGRIISNFICNGLKNGDITIYGDGSQTRSFCYCEDTIEGLIFLMNSDVHEPINIGNPDERSIMDVAKYIQRQVGGHITYKEIPQDDPTHRCPDITRAHQLLGWYPKTSFDKGISKTIEYFRGVV